MNEATYVFEKSEKVHNMALDFDVPDVPIERNKLILKEIVSTW